jgi:hypothetical protein
MNKKEITDYFRSNIFEAFAGYTVWKMLSHSKSSDVVSKEMAEKYTEIQNYHVEFFSSVEKALLLSWVVLVLHPFDKRRDVHSFYKIDRSKTASFVSSHESVLDALFALRNYLFAHRNKDYLSKNFILPSVVNMDNFFESLIQFFNELTLFTDQSATDFMFAKSAKYATENLFMNVYRGELMRRGEIDIRYSWEENNKKASDIL